MTQTRDDEGLILLGSQGTSYPQDYDPGVLETFENKHPGNDYFVKFNCPEFTAFFPRRRNWRFPARKEASSSGFRMAACKALR